MTTKKNAERLEVIKTESEREEIAGVKYMSIRLQDFEWLIQQAERAQELETVAKGFASAVEIYSEMPLNEAMNQLLKFAQEDSK